MKMDQKDSLSTDLVTVSNKVVLPSGLTDNELERYFHDTEIVSSTKNGLIKKEWLINLEGANNEELLWDNREKYGFVNNPTDPDKRPIGYGFAGDYLSTNCATCHTSFMRKGNDLVIAVGGSNNIATGGYGSANLSLIKTLENKDKLLRFQNRINKTSDNEVLDPKLKTEIEAWVNNYTTSYIKCGGGLELNSYRDFSNLVEIGSFLAWLKGESAHGGGHPFIISQNLWFGEENWYDQVSSVDIPYIYEVEHQDRIHYNGSTNSLMERNIISSLNAYNNPTLDNLMETDPRKLHEINLISENINAPKWPENLFGKIDKVKASKGKLLFSKYCQSCHSDHVDGPIKMLSFSEKSIGTDGAYFDVWRQPVVNLFGKKEQKYENALMTAMSEFKSEWYPKYNITEEEAIAMDPSPWWKFTTEWVGRPVTGIWSTAPYLHNGSVPTLYDILLPADQRPSKWTMNHYMDTMKVGIDISRSSSPDDGSFTYTNDGYGKSNKGHEYGTNMSDKERYQLIEYLKSI